MASYKSMFTGKGQPVGTGKTPSGTPSPSEQQLQARGYGMNVPNQQLQNTLTSQYLEALNTGGIGARIPIAQQAVEGSRAATSSALSQIDTSMAGTGLGRSPYAANLRNQALMQGELATEAIPTDIAKAFIAGAPGWSGTQTAQELGALGTGGALYNTRLGQSAQASSAKGGQGLGALLSIAGIAAAAACWIAAVLYGEFTPQWFAARYYIFEKWHGRLARIVRRLYIRYGEALAKHRWICLMLKPLFDVAVRRGQGW